MRTTTFVANRIDLMDFSSKQLRINLENGTLRAGDKAKTKFVTIRPAMKHAIEFLGCIKTQRGLLVAISDNIQTRFYLFANEGRRHTFVTNNPCTNISQVPRVLLQAFLENTNSLMVMLYSVWYTVILESFQEEGVAMAVGVEGNRRGEYFIASVEWVPELDDKFAVSATFDTASSRFVLANYHPIEATHRASRR